MREKRIGVIGHFGGNQVILDGQTIKTKILFSELQQSTNWKLIKVDTYYKNQNPLKLLLETLYCLLSTQDIIVLLSRNGMRYYFPLLYVWAKVFHTRVYHDVIGGNLDKYVAAFPKYNPYLNAFQKNWVETDGLKTKLERLGIRNCEVIPNFKRLNITQVDAVKCDEPYKFCTFSRVMKEKGIETAIEAVEAINAEAGRMVCRLDIYGRIDEGYNEAFRKMMEKSSDAIAYQGTVPYEKSVEAIRTYDALLFPTYWEGEGFPGTIVDAFSAGLPVIATDWNCNGEIIESGKNGILYPNGTITNLQEAIRWLIAHREQMPDFKRNCIQSAQKYQPDRYIKQIADEINAHA